MCANAARAGGDLGFSGAVVTAAAAAVVMAMAEREL